MIKDTSSITNICKGKIDDSFVFVMHAFHLWIWLLEKVNINYLILLEKCIPVIILKKIFSFNVAQRNPVIQIPQPYGTAEQ